MLHVISGEGKGFVVNEKSTDLVFLAPLKLEEVGKGYRILLLYGNDSQKNCSLAYPAIIIKTSVETTH